MYEDTILPVTNKNRIPSRTRARIYFVQHQTNKSLVFLKWIELVVCLVGLCFAILTTNATDTTNLIKVVIVMASSFGVLLVLAEITYPHFERALPLFLQVLAAGTNFTIHGLVTVLLYHTNHNHDLLRAVLFLNGFICVLFLIDFICKIVISTYLNQMTRIKSVVDIGVSAFLPSPMTSKPKTLRTAATVTPITYGGTFPIGKNEPPFQRAGEELGTPEKGIRHICIQTTSCGDSKGVNQSTYEVGPSALDRLIPRSHNAHIGREEKETSTEAPFYLQEERRKKATWTFSTPTTSRKIEARKVASMSTPITYSGTFAVNKELVPITPAHMISTSPSTSPRKKPNLKSEGTSPMKKESAFVDVGRLTLISEEKLSSLQSSADNSLTRSNCAFYSASVLPGGVLDSHEYGSTNRF